MFLITQWDECNKSDHCISLIIPSHECNRGMIIVQWNLKLWAVHFVAQLNYLLWLGRKSLSYELAPGTLLLYSTAMPSIQWGFFFPFLFFSFFLSLWKEFSCAVKWLNFFCLTLGSKQVALCNDIPHSDLKCSEKEKETNLG